MCCQLNGWITVHHPVSPDVCCPNHLVYNVFGHRNCRNAACKMKLKSKEEWKVIQDFLESNKIAAEVARLVFEGKIYLISCRPTNH